MSTIKQKYFELMEEAYVHDYTHEEQDENLEELIGEVQVDYIDRDYVTDGGDSEYRKEHL